MCLDIKTQQKPKKRYSERFYDFLFQIRSDIAVVLEEIDHSENKVKKVVVSEWEEKETLQEILREKFSEILEKIQEN